MASGNDDEQTRSLTSPEVVREITQGLEEINQSLKSVQDEFSKIQYDLEGVKDGALLVGEWQSLNTVNKRLNGDFRKRANDVQGFLHDFEMVVLKKAQLIVDDPSNEPSRKAAEKEAGFVLGDSEALSQKINSLVSTFSTFRTGLENFDASYDAFAAKEQTEKGKQIKAKTNDIDDLERKREGIKTQIKNVAREHLERMTGPRFNWLWDLPIGRIITILLEITLNRKVEQEIKELQKQYDDLTQEILNEKIALGKLQVDSDALGDISAKLFLQASVHLNRIQGGVSLFKELYTLANDDCVSVSEYLKSPNSIKVPDILREYISQHRSVYVGLISALSQFTVS